MIAIATALWHYNFNDINVIQTKFSVQTLFQCSVCFDTEYWNIGLQLWERMEVNYIVTHEFHFNSSSRPPILIHLCHVMYTTCFLDFIFKMFNVNIRVWLFLQFQLYIQSLYTFTCSLWILFIQFLELAVDMQIMCIPLYMYNDCSIDCLHKCIIL